MFFFFHFPNVTNITGDHGGLKENIHLLGAVLIPVTTL